MKVDVPRIIVALVVVLVTASFGLGYGHANHNTYLIDGLTKLHPDFLKYDWFARETVHYHPAFSYIMRIASIGGSLAWNIALINSACIAITMCVAYRICTRLSTTNPATVFLLFACLVVLEKTVTISGTFVFASYLQPSALAYTMTAVAMWYFLRGHFVRSGVALMGAGLFHANFLVLGFVFFGFAHCLLGTDRLLKRLTTQLAGSVVLLLYNLPFLIEMATHEQSGWTREIFLTIRSPHHYLPLTYLWDFAPFVGWHVAALGAFGLADMDPTSRKRTIAMYLGFLVPIVVATVLTTAVFLPFVAQLFVWRMAPFSIMFAQLICLSAVVRYLLGAPGDLPAVAYWRRGLFCAAIVMIAMWNLREYRFHPKPQFVVAAVYLGAIALALLVRRVTDRKQSTTGSVKAVNTMALGLLGACLWATASDTREISTLLNGFPGEQEDQLYAWVRNTVEDAVFVVPLEMENFRLHGARAIVVDWKSTPVDPDGLLQWYSRVADVSGVERFRSKAEAVAGYASMDLPRIRRLASRYNATYLVRETQVLDDESKTGLAQYPTVFRNDEFEVKALSSLPADGKLDD